MDKKRENTNAMKKSESRNVDLMNQCEPQNIIMLDNDIIKDESCLSFDTIMNFWPCNRTVFQEIQKNISDIVPMIGAGLSQGITKEGDTYPTWERLLRKFAEKMGTNGKNIIEGELKANNYEDAAEKLAHIVGERPLLTYVKQEFSSDKIDEDKLKSSAVLEVVKLFETGLMLTTNYDKATEKAYNILKRDDPIEILIPSSPKKDFVRVARRSCNFSALYKFHGDIDRGWEDIIFTKSSYENAYGNNEDTELDKNLSFCLLTHPILFLGCSLTKDRILNLLLNNKEGFHFAFVACGSSNRFDFDCEKATEEAIKKTAELDKMGIMPVFYPRFDRNCINELLKELKKAKVANDESKSLSSLHVQVSDNKKDWIHDKLQELDSKTKQIVFFGGIISTLRKFNTNHFKSEDEQKKTKENFEALKKWLINTEEAQLYFCYDYGEAAKNRTLQVQSHLTLEETRKKVEEILYIPNAFDDEIRSKIFLVPLTYSLTGYPIIVGKDLFWNIILDGRSSSESVLRVCESSIDKYYGYMQFALDVSNERLTMIKKRYDAKKSKLADNSYWENMCPQLFEDTNFKEIKNNIKRLEKLLTKGESNDG